MKTVPAVGRVGEGLYHRASESGSVILTYCVEDTIAYWWWQCKGEGTSDMKDLGDHHKPERERTDGLSDMEEHDCGHSAIYCRYADLI